MGIVLRSVKDKRDEEKEVENKKRDIYFRSQ